MPASATTAGAGSIRTACTIATARRAWARGTRWRHRLLKFLDRHGRLYVTGKNWSQRHWTWIRAQHFDLPPLQRTFEATRFALEQALAHQAELEKEIEAFAQQSPYAEPVGWLRCFRGIDTLSAMILVAEIVDFQRFRRPRELMAYLGLVPQEWSSGETQRRGRITKAGSGRVRCRSTSASCGTTMTFRMKRSRASTRSRCGARSGPRTS